MAKSDKIKVSVTNRYNVPAERIYDTLLDPEKAKKFMFSTITGKMVKAEIDAQEGGDFLFVDRRPEGDAAHYGKYLKLQRPSLVSFQFAMVKDAKDADQVDIEIAQLKQGSQVTLTHHVNADYAHLKDRIAQGWEGILDGLGEALRSR